MKKDISQSLMVLVVWYFLAYVLTGIFPKMFTEGLGGVPKMDQIQFLVYSAFASGLVCCAVSWMLGWHKYFKTITTMKLGPFTVSKELVFLIIPSGIFTAIIVPTTTMMYSFKGINIILAIVMMRGCVVIIGRIVDAILIHTKVLDKKVSWEENVAVVFAVAAVCVGLFMKTSKVTGHVEFFNFAGGELDFIQSTPVMVTMILYVGSYFGRLFIMNYYKNKWPCQNDQRAYILVEQTTVLAALLIAAVVICCISSGNSSVITAQQAIKTPADFWIIMAFMAGIPFGLASFPSIFMFLMKKKTGTFTALANRLTSLVAGTVATLLLVWLFDQKPPKIEEWVTFALVLVAVGFLYKSERRHR